MLFSLKIQSLLVREIEIWIHVHHNSFVAHGILQKSNRVEKEPISDQPAPWPSGETHQPDRQRHDTRECTAEFSASAGFRFSCLNLLFYRHEQKL